MKTGKRIFYIGIIFISALVFDINLVDYYQIPRFIVSSFSLFLISILFYADFIKGKCSLELNPLIILPAIFYIFNLLSLLWSINQSESIYESQKIFLWLSIILFTYYFSKDKSFEKNVTRTLSFITIILLIFGFWEYLALPDKQRNFLYKITVLSGNKNLLSSFLFLLLPFNVKSAFGGGLFSKIFFTIICLMSVTLLYLLQTRSVLISLSFVLILLLILLFLNSKMKTKLIKYVAVCLISLFSIYGLHTYISNLLITSDPSAIERAKILKKSEYMIKENSVIGVGAGNWQFNYSKYGLDDLDIQTLEKKITFQRPHNDFVWILSETGIIGILLYILFIFILLFQSFSSMVKKDSAYFKYSNWIYPLFITGYLLISFFDFPKERIEHNIIYAVILGLILSNNKSAFDIKICKRKASYIFIFISIISLFNLFIGFLRYSGEYHTKSIYLSVENSEWKDVIENADKGLSFFYNVDNKSIPLHWYKGNAEFALGNDKNAEIAYSEAYKISPYNIFVLNNYSTVLIKMGDYDSAKKLCEEALKISPNYEDPKFNIAYIQYYQGNYDSAYKIISSISNDTLKKSIYLDFINKKLFEN